MPSPHAFLVVAGTTRLSLIPGLSGAGRTPKDTWQTPLRDVAFVAGKGPLPPCLTVAGVTRAVCALTGITPLFLNAGCAGDLPVPAPVVSRTPAGDPREGPSVPAAETIITDAAEAGAALGRTHTTLWIGECIPGGTTHALCILRALGIKGRVSSAGVQETTAQKEAIWEAVRGRCPECGTRSGVALIRETGDPVMAAVLGLIRGFPGETVLCGGTQMLACAALAGSAGGAGGAGKQISCAMTDLVWQDPAADVASIAEAVGIPVTISPVPDPFLHPRTRSRACIARVKEGFGAGGALALARRCGYTEEEITAALAGVTRQE